MSRQKYWLILGLVLSVTGYWLFASAITINGSSLANDFSTTQDNISLSLSITGLFVGLFIALGGKLSDKYGTYKITYLGIIIGIISYLFFVIGNDFTTFFIGRILLGVSAALIMPATLSIIKKDFYEEEQPRAVSIWSLGTFGGTGLSALVGALIIKYFSWKYIYVMAIVVSIISLLLIYKSRIQSETTYDKNKLDFLGLLFFVIGLIPINILVTQTSSLNLNKAIILLLVAIISIYIFVKIERRVEHPLVDLKLFRNINYLGSLISNFVVNMSIGVLTLITFYATYSLNDGGTKGIDKTNIGLAYLPFTVAIFLGIFYGERLLKIGFGYRAMIWGSFLVGVLGSVSLFFINVSSSMYFVMILFFLIVMGFGCGMFASANTSLIISEISEEKIGVATAMYKMCSALGSSFGIAISLGVFNFIVAQTHNLDEAMIYGLSINILFGFLGIIIIKTMINSKK